MYKTFSKVILKHRALLCHLKEYHRKDQDVFLKMTKLVNQKMPPVFLYIAQMSPEPKYL